MSIESSSIIWKIKRLISMSLLEIFGRFRRLLELKFFGIRSEFQKIDFVNTCNDSIPNNFENDFSEHKTSIENILLEADRYLDHKWLFFGLERKEEGIINWHFDHINNKYAPKKYSFAINHRKFEEVGNIKVIWEKNRHHHLTILSIAYYLTKDEKYAKEVINQITHWIQENPFLIGVNWTHPLENAIRLISWIYCERFLRKSKYYEQIFNKDSLFWLSVYQHQIFIAKTYSIGSSANNHLIGEMAGLYISCINWPFFTESKKWINFSKKIIEREIKNQSFPSGVNREMAFGYQIFVYEFYLLAFLESKFHDDIYSKSFVNLLKKNGRTISELVKKNQGIPNFGDGDEGMAIQLQELNSDRITWLMEVTASLFSEFKMFFKPNTFPAALLGYNYKIPLLKLNFFYITRKFIY